MTEQVQISSLCGRFRLVVRNKEKWIQKREKQVWVDLERWPALVDGGTISKASLRIQELANVRH